MSNLLLGPLRQLELLNISHCDIDNECASILAAAIEGRNASLKCLDIGDNPRIAGSGWEAILGALPSPKSVLQSLKVQRNHFGGVRLNNSIVPGYSADRLFNYLSD